MFLRHCGLPLVLGFLFDIMVNNGWIKLYRKICENIIWQNEKALKIWIWCLLKANHKGKEVLIGRQKVKIKPGQFIFGSNKATQELNISKSTIHYWISFLISERYIERKIFPKYSIITILNWNEYQGVERKTDAGLNADETQSSPIKETNKNVKNVKNIVKYNPQSLKLAKLLYELIKKENPAWYLKPNWDKWAEDIEKIVRIDGRTYEQVEWMVRWTQADSFWRQNILSPAKLRAKFNDLIIRAKNQNKGKKIIGL